MAYFKTLILAAALLMAAGCGNQSTIPDPEPDGSMAGMEDGANTQGGDFGEWEDGSAMDSDLMGDPSAGELASIIYFEFDSSEVRSEDTDTVSRHAMLLVDNPGASVRLEGHADERGSREYNIGLGERRAQAVRRLLLIQGASASQIATVSFGEERPANPGSSETAWADNRRVEIVYTN